MAVATKRGIPADESLLATIRAGLPSMQLAMRRVADFVLEWPDATVDMSIHELAEATGTSIGTIGQFCRSIGLSGYRSLRLGLARALPRAEFGCFELVKSTDDTKTVLEKVFSLNIRSLEDTARMIDSVVFEQVARWVAEARQLYFYGCGGSGVIARDADLYFSYLGESRAITDPGQQIVASTWLGEKDVVIGISHTGSNHATIRGLKAAADARAKTVCITNFKDSPITKVAQEVLLTSFGEKGVGSISLASRVAQMSLIEALYVRVAMLRGPRAMQKAQSMDDVVSRMWRDER